jgi:hypothetical protein
VSKITFEYSVLFATGQTDFVARLPVPSLDFVPERTWRLYRRLLDHGGNIEAWFTTEAAYRAMRAEVMRRLGGRVAAA